MRKKIILKKQKGQIIVEYILLMVVVVVIAIFILNLVDVDEGNLIQYWKKIIERIGKDIPSQH